MKKISRRNALKLFGLTTAGSVLAACAPATSTTAPEAPKPTATTASAAVEPAATTAPQSSSPPQPPQPQKCRSLISRSAFGTSRIPSQRVSPMPLPSMSVKNSRLIFTPVNVGWGDADEKYNTWAASGQLPDIIGAIAMPGTARYFQWISDGVVRALPDTSGYSEISKLMKLPEVTAFDVKGEELFRPPHGVSRFRLVGYGPWPDRPQGLDGETRHSRTQDGGRLY